MTRLIPTLAFILGMSLMAVNMDAQSNHNESPNQDARISQHQNDFYALTLENTDELFNEWQAVPIEMNDFNLPPEDLIEKIINSPLDVLSFSGITESQVNILQWETLMEEGFSSFNIEKSINGKDFNIVGEVSPKGSSNTYDFVDRNPATIAFYRLKILGVNGLYDYSNVVCLSRDKGRILHVYPNPTMGSINLSILVSDELTTAEAETADVIVLDRLGRVVKRENKGLDASGLLITRIDVSDLATGAYIVQVVGPKKTYSSRFVKN